LSATVFAARYDALTVDLSRALARLHGVKTGRGDSE